MMEEELDLREVFLILRKRIKIILLITVLAMLVSGLISYYVLSPVYKASTSLIISRTQNITINNQIQLQDIQTSRMLAATYSEIVKSRRVLQPVVTKLNLPMSVEDLKGKIDVTSKDNTEIIEISVRDNNPERAAEIANAIASSFMDNIVKIMKIDNVQVIDRAVPPTSKVSPKTSLNVVIAGVLGLMISIFLVFLLEYMDRTVKTPDDIKKYLNLPVLGIIPEVKNK
ncbi:YveK family protein [Caldanaerobacter subterraneus]|uniref:Capsular polysaccharide biosynthesis protein n=2 Tax=Caldanaerobacter subterraneus TaxID=911092 RepID=U5CEF4_CALSX|nr:Wzz/FepE/Etk N-terminal domain-containing protein [Caldanaerobacter subterraneus]ERM91305.1 capsular polysaccharide biosynthesis protein [Caldanaerobacter subterraneus subsp. yonseiensis KB-1]NNG67080.1 capsular biosynthesis protein [Caldanaerobacter subterraneus]